MTRLRITNLEERQFQTCLEKKLWGSNMPLLKPDQWLIGDIVLFKVSSKVEGLAEIVGDYFCSKEKIWDNELFPFRIPLRFVHVSNFNERPNFSGAIRDCVIGIWGKNYGFNILNKDFIEGEFAKRILDLSQVGPNKVENLGNENIRGKL